MRRKFWGVMAATFVALFGIPKMIYPHMDSLQYGLLVIIAMSAGYTFFFGFQDKIEKARSGLRIMAASLFGLVVSAVFHSF